MGEASRGTPRRELLRELWRKYRKDFLVILVLVILYSQPVPRLISEAPMPDRVALTALFLVLIPFAIMVYLVRRLVAEATEASEEVGRALKRRRAGRKGRQKKR